MKEIKQEELRRCAKCKKEYFLGDFIFNGRLHSALCKYCLQEEFDSSEVRLCSKCKKYLPIYMFPRRENDKYLRRQSQCNNCRAKHQKTINNPPDLNLKFKKCSVCLTELPIEHFSYSKKSKDGYHTSCKKCHAEYAKKHRSQKVCSIFGFDLSIATLRHKIDRYNLSYKEVINLIENTNGICPICNKPFKNIKCFSVDHDHKTNKVRGIICNSCNLMLGQINDDIDILKSAIKYLENAQIDARGCI